MVVGCSRGSPGPIPASSRARSTARSRARSARERGRPAPPAGAATTVVPSATALATSVRTSSQPPATPSPTTRPAGPGHVDEVRGVGDVVVLPGLARHHHRHCVLASARQAGDHPGGLRLRPAGRHHQSGPTGNVRRAGSKRVPEPSTGLASRRQEGDKGVVLNSGHRQADGVPVRRVTGQVDDIAGIGPPRRRPGAEGDRSGQTNQEYRDRG